MADLPIQHVIFTRVESAFSPRNINGYQIVYQSSGLGNEIIQIEKRLQCFEPGRRGGERYQFFWTEKGQVVLAKTVSLLQPDPEVIDRTQRNAFLAHALVLSKEAFASIRNDPFAVFTAAEDKNLFAEDVEQLVDYLQGKAPADRLLVLLRKRADVNYLLEGWPPEELLKLFRLGLQAPALSRRGQSILLLTEDQDELFNLLSLVLMLIPFEERMACTFDTCVDGCYPTSGAFWLMGSSRGKNHSGLLPIRLLEHRLENEGGDDVFLDPKALACLT